MRLCLQSVPACVLSEPPQSNVSLPPGHLGTRAIFTVYWKMVKVREGKKSPRLKGERSQLALRTSAVREDWSKSGQAFNCAFSVALL